PGRIERRSVQEDDLRFVFIRFVGLSVEHFHTGGALGVFVVQYPRDNAPRTEGQVTRLHGCGKCRRLCAKISSERTPQPAAIAELALFAAFKRAGYVCRATDNHVALAVILLLDTRGYVFFHTVQIHRREEVAIRQVRNAIADAADAGELLDIVVPRFDFFITHGPVERDALACISFEVEVREPTTLSAPQQRTTTHL